MVLVSDFLLKVRKHLNWLKGGFPADKILYAGIVNGKNIWRNNYEKSLAILEQVPAENVVSCSLHITILQLLMKILNQLFWTTSPLRFKKKWVVRDLDAIRNGQGAEALAANKDSLRLSVLVKMLSFVLVLQV